MHFEIRYPTPALQPYITRYVFVRAEGSTDTMVPPDDDPRFVNGKHVQQLLPNYGSLVFMRNAKADFNGTFSDGLTILGPYRKPVALTTLSGWFEGMLLDFEPGGLHALLGIDLQQIGDQILTAAEYGDEGLKQCDQIFKSATDAEMIANLIDAFFAGHLPRRENMNYSRLQKAIEACDALKGDISTSRMAEEACLSERQFLRIFRQYVGIPPKQFIRLRRFHRTLQHMQKEAAAGHPIDLIHIALCHGYYDLSHMALEFQQMGCFTPSHFRMLGIPLTDDFSIFFA